MASKLNIAGLNGLLIDPSFVGLEASAKKVSGGYTVSATGNHSVATFPSFVSGPPSGGKPITVFVRETTSPQGFTFFVSAKQKSDIGDGGGLITKGFLSTDQFKLGGWNANAILLIGRTSGTLESYTVISDHSLLAGTPTNLNFSNTGPGPTVNGVALIICFAAGTRLATAQGYAAVEHLQPGDLVRTVSGALQPIVWVGQRTVCLASHPQPGQAAPICIAAHAFGPGLPLRELAVSPEHALFVDRALVAAQALVNGATIRQVAVDTITYYHVDLPQHDVVLAEGLPAETYLDTGSRTALTRYDRLAHAA